MINAKNFGLAGGIFWGVSLFLLTIISVFTGFAGDVLVLLKGVYIGYDITLLGSVIGLIYAFLDGFIGCYIFIWIYNKLEK